MMENMVTFQDCCSSLNKNVGKKKIENMGPTKVCMFREHRGTVYFLVCVICIMILFNSCTGTTYPFMFNFVHPFSKVKLPPVLED